MKIKTNSKENEKIFIENVREFFEKPEVILPECTDSCFLCPIKSYRKKIETMSQKDNYDKYYNSADQFLSSISETYKILNNEKAPILGVIKTNYGSVTFCKRGKTDETIIAGVQNYKNDIYRLLAFTNVVKNKKINIFSSKNYFTATCKNNINVEFLKDLFEEENITYNAGSSKMVLGKSGNKMIFNIYNITFEIYEDYEPNIIFTLYKHILIPLVDIKITTDFMTFIPDDKNMVKGYLANKINTKEFLSKMRKYKISYAIQNKYYIIENVNYSIDDFLDKLGFDSSIKPFIREKLEDENKGIYLETASQRKIYEQMFPKYKHDIIKIMFNLDDHEIGLLKGNPMEIINAAADVKSKNKIKKKILEPWSENSKYLINLLVDYFNYGKNEAIKNGRKNLKNNIYEKSIYYSFLKSLNENEEWLFSENEKFLGNKIYPYIKNVIDGQDVNEELNKIKMIID